MTNSLDKETITKKPQLYCPEYFKIKNYSTENQENRIESEILDMGPLKNANKIRQIKYDRKYI